MNCYACNAELTGDVVDDYTGEPPTYQFDNALWIGFHGGYGMFVDNLEATLPTNTEDRWLRDANGEYLLNGGALPHPVENHVWEPEYREDRMLPGHPDYEAVICHECAHQLCADVPWIERLIHAHNSHSHKTSYHEAHPEHWGWDYTGPQS